MPLRLDVKVSPLRSNPMDGKCIGGHYIEVCLLQRKLLARSDRVKCMDLHPKEPWMLASLYNGNVHVWNHETQASSSGKTPPV